jgi:hypothetical protein
MTFPKFRSKAFPWKTWEYYYEHNGETKFYIIYRENENIISKVQVPYIEWYKRLEDHRILVRKGLAEEV